MNLVLLSGLTRPSISLSRGERFHLRPVVEFEAISVHVGFFLFPDVWRSGDRRQLLRSRRLELFIMKNRPGSCSGDAGPSHSFIHRVRQRVMAPAEPLRAAEREREREATSALSMPWPFYRSEGESASAQLAEAEKTKRKPQVEQTTFRALRSS